jgi:hypothetical protein
LTFFLLPAETVPAPARMTGSLLLCCWAEQCDSSPYKIIFKKYILYFSHSFSHLCHCLRLLCRLAAWLGLLQLSLLQLAAIVVVGLLKSGQLASSRWHGLNE